MRLYFMLSHTMLFSTLRQYALFHLLIRGDEVEFNLTLDGHLLMETRGHGQSQRNWAANRQPLAGSKTEDKSSTSNFTISLPGELTGHLMCSVWNNVSRDETVIHLTRCKGTVLKGCFLSFYI